MKPDDPAAGPAWVWGVPFAPLTMAEAIEAVDALIERRRPSYFITANTHYAMLTRELPRLREVNARAAFIVADGAPLVWASRRGPAPLPERVAGSDLIYGLCAMAARRGRRVFLLGGGPTVAEAAARNLAARCPGLVVAGVESPPFRALDAEESEALLGRIRAAEPDLLFVAFGQPKGELWIAEHHEALGVPVSVQVGASLDFAAGRVRRAPRWMQRAGLEWAYRLALEPRRLASRYARNAWFILRMVLGGPSPAPAPPGDGRGAGRSRSTGVLS